MAKVLKGKEVIAQLNDEVKQRSEKLQEQGVQPALAVVRLGERPDDLAYERGLTKRAEKTGVQVKSCVYPEDLSQEDLLKEIRALNQDPSVHGVLIFRPLPKAIDDKAVRAALAPEKDVDGITDASQAGVYTGSGEGFAPCTAEACIRLLKHFEIPMEGKRAVVIGRSQVIGKPVSLLLLSQNATVTICHSRTRNLPEVCQSADIIVAAAGHPGTVTRECLRSGQTVVDVAVNVGADGKMCGDADYDAALEIADAVTPVPGGVGTVTSTVLMDHVVTAAERAQNK
ncbi:MAG: bifunctional 5,10-methylenetetrahydrofolate dehydrogenase/5,10-methenyltetrahydrofolate cyclohydrolase [Eubacterium sp.]